MNEQLTTLQRVIDLVIEFAVQYSFQVIGAVIILIVGTVIANWITSLMMKMFEKKKMDVTFSRFVAGIVRLMVIGFAVIVAMGNFGITIAPFIAALGALAFGASFAIQGPLSNYGAGLSIIMARPFVVGDTITVAGVSGVVQEVKLACTVLTTEDGVKITVPNKEIVGQVIQNSRHYRIVEGTVGISYSDDPGKAIETVIKVIQSNPDVTDTPAPQVGIAEFGDSSVNIGYRYWAPTVKYYQVLYAVNLEVYRAVQAAGLTIPFPQRDVHLIPQPGR